MGRVYISANASRGGKRGQHFEGIPPEVWEFQLGGYQPMDKWLKDRRGRTLSFDDLGSGEEEEVEEGQPVWQIHASKLPGYIRRLGPAEFQGQV